MSALFPADSTHLLSVMDQPDAPSGCQVFLCPGCRNWQVEYDDRLPADMDSHPRFDETFGAYAALVHAAEQAAVEHRAVCPPFDMLAGLRGIPALGTFKGGDIEFNP